MPLTRKAINQLEMAKTAIAAEILASSNEFRAWVAVAPPRPATRIPSPTDRFREFYIVSRVEIPKQKIENWTPDDLYNQEIKYVRSIADVQTVLEQWSIDAEKLEAPWKCDYPL